MNSHAEVVDNANSIADIPYNEFPDLAAKFHLMIRALNGEGIYAYRPFGGIDWILWIGCDDPTHDCRYSITQYCEQFNKEREESNP